MREIGRITGKKVIRLCPVGYGDKGEGCPYGVRAIDLLSSFSLYSIIAFATYLFIFEGVG